MSIEIINQIGERISKINYLAANELDELKEELKKQVHIIFGNKSEYLSEIEKINMEVVYYSEEQMEKDWYANCRMLKKILNSIAEEVSMGNSESQNELKEQAISKTKVLVGYGNSKEINESLFKTLQKQKLEVVDLQAIQSQSNTTIEIIKENEVTFAIILLSDEIQEDSEDEKIKARYKINFEIGYLIGKLGKERVIVLVNKKNDVEQIFGYNSVNYIEYDKNNNWKSDIAKVMKG